MDNISILFVRLDAHKKSINVAYLINSHPVELPVKIALQHRY